MARSGGGIGNLASCKRVAQRLRQVCGGTGGGPRGGAGSLFRNGFPGRAASGQKAKEAFTSPRRS